MENNLDYLINKIKDNHENHKSGYFNCIPFDEFPRLEYRLPGIELATYYNITANSGVGKSKIARALFVHKPLMYAKENPSIKVDILYFSLEESKEKIILTEMVRYLHSAYGFNINIKQLQSVGRHNEIPYEVLNKLEEAKEHAEKVFSSIHIITNQRNPTGIYKTVRDFAYKNGYYYDSDGVEFTDEEMEAIRSNKGTPYMMSRISGFKLSHPRHYVIVLIDHISLLQPEKGAETLKLAIDKMSNDYCLRFRDNFGLIPVVVQQQASDKEKTQFTSTGKNIFEKLEPSLEGLGDSKTTQRDANVVLGLFAPNRYGMDTHHGYDINFFRDNYRSLSILKSRDGDSNFKVPLFFDGSTDTFKELPKLEDTATMMRVRAFIENLRNTN